MKLFMISLLIGAASCVKIYDGEKVSKPDPKKW